jgi:hypothetical protein
MTVDCAFVSATDEVHFVGRVRGYGKDATPGASTTSAGPAPGTEDDRPLGLAPGSDDDRPPGRAPRSEDGRPRHPAPGTQGANSTGLPSWSAFRRYPLPQENPPRAPATGKQ